MLVARERSVARSTPLEWKTRSTIRPSAATVSRLPSRETVWFSPDAIPE